MANDPKKKPENAADAPPSSVPASASTPVQMLSADKAQGTAPTAREVELQAQLEDLRGELELLRQERGPDLNDARLFALVDRLGEAIGAGVAKALAADRLAQRPGQHKKPPKPPLPDEFKGPRTYTVGPSKAYQNGRLFQPGDKITVVDQFPARDWKPVEEADAPAPKTAPASKPARAADQSVG